MHITTTANDTPNASWVCQVSLLQKYDHAPSMSVPNENKLHPWVLRAQPYTAPFKTLHAKDSLEDVVRWAQVAILNPSYKDVSRYLDGARGAVPSTSEVAFSPNVLKLDISGPGLPELALFDLPGVINQADDGSGMQLPRLIRNLVREYIKAENTLVLLACSMETDFQNSTAAGIVRQMGAQHRTVGMSNTSSTIHTLRHRCHALL